MNDLLATAFFCLLRRDDCGKLFRNVLVILLLAFGIARNAAAEGIPNQDCLDCHGETQVRKIDGKSIPVMAFPTNSFTKSVHGKLSCVDCHRGMKVALHDPGLPDELLPRLALTQDLPGKCQELRSHSLLPVLSSDRTPENQTGQTLNPHSMP